MSLDARPNPLRTLAERKALWLAVPAIALLAGLAMIGSWSVTPPKAVAQAQPAPAPALFPAAVATTAVPLKPETTAPFSPEQKQELGKIIKETTVPPKPETQATFSSEQKQELGKIIKEYLIANPEIFLEAQTALEAKMEKEQAEKLKVAIAENCARNLSRPEGRHCRQPQRRHHGRRVLRLQLRLLQAWPARRHQARRERPEGSRRVQGTADSVEGLGGGLARRHRRRQAGQVLGHAQADARGQRAR